jgi:hypothetical protein
VVLAFLHLILAAVAAGALAVALGGGALAAAVAALLYAGSFQLISSIYSPPLLYAAAWAPFVVTAVDRLVAAVTWQRIVLLAAAVAMMLLCGWPYTFAITAVGTSIYGGALLAAKAVRERRLPGPALVAIGVGVLAGVMLAAPQLLPTRELLASSCRAIGSIVESQAIFVDKAHDPEDFLRTFSKHGYNEAIPGALALLLAVLAVVLPGPGRARVATLLGVGVVGLLASFPNDVAVYRWLRELPLLGDFRFPFRYRFLTSLALSVGAGLGAAHLVARLRAWPNLARGAGAAVLVLCVGFVTVPTLRGSRPFPRSVPPTPTLSEELRAAGIDRAPDARDRVYWSGRANKRGADLAIDVIYDMEPMSLARTAEFITFFETGRPRTLVSRPEELDARSPRGDSIAAPFFGLTGIPSDASRAALLDLLSVRWIVTAAPRAWLAERYRRVTPPDAELAVFENRGALPRAYRVPGALPTPPRLPAALRGLAGPDFDPRHHVLLERPPVRLLRAARAGVRDPAAAVEIERYGERHLALRTRGRFAGVVVVTDAYYPGWEATLDGEPTPVLRANTAFRGVLVPPGEHVVEMRYASAALERGALVALAGLAGLAVTGVVERRRRR